MSLIGPIRQELLSGIRTPEAFERLRDHLQPFADEHRCTHLRRGRAPAAAHPHDRRRFYAIRAHPPDHAARWPSLILLVCQCYGSPVQKGATPFAPGDRVHVAGLGTGIVRGARNGGRYLIELKGRAMVVDGSQLQPAEPARAGRGKRPAVDATTGDSAAGPSSTPPSLDLHGQTVLDALDALDAFLNNALLDGMADVRVIHGRGGGTLKAAVHRRLTQLPSVRAFRLDPGNPGVTLVSL